MENLLMPENLVMTSAYAGAYLLTELIRLGKEVLEMYIAFCFGTKLTSLGATDRIARAKF